ncbi:MAG: hypothetical protein PSX36_07330 [bacterium]|nr:hypothetical protein [bacterium]
MFVTKKLTVIGISVFLLGACGGHKEAETGEEGAVVEGSKDSAAVAVADTTAFKFDFAIANVPSPANTIQNYVKWGVSYDNSILNSPKKADSYNTEYLKSINLGVYNIDMAYAMASNSGADVLQYMKSILMISDGLGLKGAVDKMVGKRAESNMNNQDSLFAILDEIMVRSDFYLRSNERLYTAANILAGCWVESLYLNCKIGDRISDSGNKDLAKKRLWDQRFHLGNLLNLLGDYKDKKDCAELIAKLKPIHEEITAVKQPTDLTEEKFKSISSKIYALRENYTK